MNNNPIIGIDPDGNYTVSAHYKLTNNAMMDLGIGSMQADLLAHYSSVFADHPKPLLLGLNNAVSWGAPMSYRFDINYNATSMSQDEFSDISNSWHSMTARGEENDLSRRDALLRGLKFGWDKIFESAREGNIKDLEKNSKGLEAFGQGIHALQDAFAHGGGTWDGHSLRNDMRGDRHPGAIRMTKSAAIVNQVLNGDFSGLMKHLSGGDGMLKLVGMSSSQKREFYEALKRRGYTVVEDGDEVQ